MAGFFFRLLLLMFSTCIVIIGSEKNTQCYWCGPRADQVNKSERAPVCGQELSVITCDAGYKYCAYVMETPPLTESRICLKNFKDHCYNKFCNSTNTWRATCPCQGDLCNGKKQSREEKALVELLKMALNTNNTNADNKKEKIIASEGKEVTYKVRRSIIDPGTHKKTVNATYDRMNPLIEKVKIPPIAFENMKPYITDIKKDLSENPLNVDNNQTKLNFEKNMNGNEFNVSDSNIDSKTDIDSSSLKKSTGVSSTNNNGGKIEIQRESAEKNIDALENKN